MVDRKPDVAPEPPTIRLKALWNELWRSALWGVAAAAALAVAVYAVSTETGLTRIKLAFAQIHGNAPPAPPPPQVSDESWRLGEAVRRLAADRDRLLARIASLERSLDHANASIARMEKANQAAQTTPAAENTSSASARPPKQDEPAATPPPPAPRPPQQASPAAQPEPVPRPQQHASPAPPPPPPPPASRPPRQASPAVPQQPATLPPRHATPPAPPGVRADTTADEPAEIAHDITGGLPPRGEVPIPPRSPTAAGSPVAARSPARAPAPPPRAAAQTPSVAPTTPARASAHAPRLPPPPTAPEPAAPRREFGLDLGPAPSMEVLRAIWATTRRHHAAQLAGLQPFVSTIERRFPPGTELRLIAGPVPSAAVAARLCAAITAGGGVCQPAEFEGEQLAVR